MEKKWERKEREKGGGAENLRRGRKERMRERREKSNRDPSEFIAIKHSSRAVAVIHRAIVELFHQNRNH